MLEKTELGPILGHSTVADGFASIKIWARFAKIGIGVVAYRMEGSADGTGPSFGTFRLVCAPTNAGVVTLTQLAPGVTYEYKVGLSTEARIAQEFHWSDFSHLPAHQFVSHPSSEDRTRFILGSCRHWGNTPIESLRQGDAAFARIRDECLHGAQFLLHAGDQVYADHRAKSFGGYFGANRPPDNYRGYLDQYRAYYDQPGFASVTASIPNYMIFDDHEIQNNWSGGKFFNREYKHKENFDEDTYYRGMLAYLSHQAMFGPWADDPSNRKAVGALYDSREQEKRNALKDSKHYYQFDFGSCKFFVMDVRGQRELLASQYKKLPKNFPPPRMIGQCQLKALRKFLEKDNDANTVKFIVSPVPFFPDYTGLASSPEDIWTGYAEQRMEILNSIGEIADQHGEGYTRPIFLSGDVHHSLVAKLTLTTDLGNKLELFSVISSAFNWYFWGLQRLSIRKRGDKSNLISHWQRKGRFKTDENAFCEVVSDVEKRNCYTVISVAGKKVTVERYPPAIDGPYEIQT